MSDVAVTVGANVRAEMARAGVSQRQIAKVLKLSQAQVSQRILGRIPFDVVELEQVATYLGRPAATFLGVAA